MIFGNAQVRQYIHFDTLAPAVLFIGPEGVGKYTFALELVSGLNKAQVKLLPKPTMGDVRELVEWSYTSYFGNKIKVAVVDFSHAAQDAQNALLKLLEEPPVKFKLIIIGRTRSVIPTIVSRCFRYRFLPLLRTEVVDVLEELGYTLDSAQAASDYADGSVTKALDYMERASEQRQALSSAFSYSQPAQQAQAFLPMKQVDMNMALDALRERGELTPRIIAILLSNGGARARLLLARMLS